MKKIGFMFCLVFFFAPTVAPVTAAPAKQVTAEERMIGATFKTLARAYVATANIDELKKRTVQRISAMKPERFRKKYAEVYVVARELPPRLQKQYGLRSFMTRAEAIDIIRSLDKPKLYELIDNLPDQAIADRFLEHQAENGVEAERQGLNLTEAIGDTWQKMVKNINKPPKKSSAGSERSN